MHSHSLRLRKNCISCQSRAIMLKGNVSYGLNHGYITVSSQKNGYHRREFINREFTSGLLKRTRSQTLFNWELNKNMHFQIIYAGFFGGSFRVFFCRLNCSSNGSCFFTLLCLFSSSGSSAVVIRRCRRHQFVTIALHHHFL